ncbi:Histone H2A.Z [Leucoagaricus sp. SymC.cos]|nr:Histone H2A.Z [Leucoagaricus sp. SymC.cos]
MLSQGAISRETRSFGYLTQCHVKRRKYITSRGHNVGLRFPVGDLRDHLRRSTRAKFMVSDDAAAFTCGVIEYLCAEILEQAGLISNPEQSLGTKVIQPAHLQMVFLQDTELRQLLSKILPTSARPQLSHQATAEPDLCRAFQSLSIYRRT